MNLSDQRNRHDDLDRSPASLLSPFPHHPPKSLDPDNPRPELTLLVAGSRGGKTSFLRLLLDTSEFSPLSTKEQLHSVAKFVQGCSGHTSYIKSVSIDINLDIDGSRQRPLGLTLIDTPSLDFRDDASTDRIVTDMLRHIDQRFGDGLEDERKAQTGDCFVHLCIYFLDPDQIIPLSIPGPPAPPVPRTRANSFTQIEQEPVILDPPVATNPLLTRATLPPADITTIRRLSARVNVLPVIARADLLPTERLAAVKVAIRKDLADAGIGFGIFDIDTQYPRMQDDHPSIVTDSPNGFGTLLNGNATTRVTPPTSPVTPLLRLPYALISPDNYSHSDGVPRSTPSRHELFNQYNLSSQHNQSPGQKLTRGKYIRSYRWGSLDVLDPSHSDFVPLRTAIFHHMETLQKYTREYLFEKYRSDYAAQRPPSRHALSHQITQPMHLGPITHPTRPTLAIDTAAHPVVHRLPVPHRDAISDHGPIPRLTLEPLSSASPTKTPAPRSSRPRTKKITVACNFCRSRKLKCDGGRPACSQCTKRSNSCDYMPQTRRRVRQRKGDESESESADDNPADQEEQSPETSTQMLGKRSNNLKIEFPQPLPRMAHILHRREEVAPNPSTSRPKLAMPPADSRPLFPDHELPHIATLSLPEPSPSTTPAPVSAPSLPPIRPASEQLVQRKRSATVPGKSTRQSSSSGPKVVACNFCRARKTKCDGAHPACASCARRSLQCNYVHDNISGSGTAQKRSRRSSSSKPHADESPQSLSPPSSRMIPTPSTAQDAYVIVQGDKNLEGELTERPVVEYPDTRPTKKMKVENDPAMGDIHSTS